MWRLRESSQIIFQFIVVRCYGSTHQALWDFAFWLYFAWRCCGTVVHWLDSQLKGFKSHPGTYLLLANHQSAFATLHPVVNKYLSIAGLIILQHYSIDTCESSLGKKNILQRNKKELLLIVRKRSLYTYFASFITKQTFIIVLQPPTLTLFPSHRVSYVWVMLVYVWKINKLIVMETTIISISSKDVLLDASLEVSR